MNISASARLQGRAILALTLSRMRSQYMGSRAGYMWAIVEPLAWVFILRLALASGSHMPPVGDSYEVFFVIGVIPARMFRSIASRVAQTLRSNRGARLPGLMKLDLCYANVILDTATSAVVLLVALSILGVFGFHVIPGDILHFLAAFFAIGAFALAFGLAVGLLLFLMPGLQHFIGLFFMVIFLTSGFAFVVDRMPQQTREIVLWNPLLHLVEWVRMGFYPGYECRSMDLNYVFMIAVCSLVLGLAGERLFRRRASRRNQVYDDSANNETM